MNGNTTINEMTNPIISFSKTNANYLVIRAFKELIPVIADRFEEYNQNIGLKVPDTNQPIFTQENITNEELIYNFNLNIEKRLLIVNQSSNCLEKDSSYPPDYYAITLVQSFCTILLHDLNSIKFEYLSSFLNGFRLGWSCLPLHQDLCASMYMIFYCRFLINSPDKEFMFNHLSQIDKIGSEFSHCFLPFSSCLIESCNYLFNLIFENDDQNQVESNFNEKVSVFNDHFVFILKSINWKINETCSFTNTLFTNIIKVLPLIKKENISIIFQFLSFIAFSVQANKNSNDLMGEKLKNSENQAYSVIGDLIDKFIKENESESSIFPLMTASSQNDSSSIKMKEVKYFDFISEEPLTFSKDTNLKDYEFDPLKFNNLYDRRTTTVGIIVDFFDIITNLYSIPKTTFEILVQICKPKIEAGDLNYQAILQLFISRETKNLDKLCTFCESSRLLNTVLFNQYLFDCSVSLFDYKKQEKADNKILMRIHLFSLIKELASSKPKPTEILNSIIFLLNFYIGSCQMFTEIIYILNQLQVFSVFPEDLQLAIVELISSEISVQQQWHIQDAGKAQIFRPIFLSLISEIALNFKFNDAMLRSRDFVKSFFSLIFEPDIFETFFEIFCKLSISYIQSAESDLFTYLQPTIQTAMRSILLHFSQLNNYPDQIVIQNSQQQKQQHPMKVDGQINVQKHLRMIQVFCNFILILQFLINDGMSNFISLFVKFQLFEMFTNIITSLPLVTPSSEPSLISATEGLILLIIDIFEKFSISPMVKKSVVNYNVLIKPIQALTITETLYNKLKMQVCYPNIQFKSIERPEILSLLIFSTENSDYFPQILNEISILCRDSIWNCFSVFNSGILVKLLEQVDLSEDQSFIFTTTDQKKFDILEMILNLFCYVNIFVSSRQLLYAFTRLFHVFDDISLGHINSQPHQKTLTPHIESYMNCFRTVFTIRSHIPSSFIHFASSQDYVEMKSPLMRELMNGFTISIWLLLDAFNNDENCAFSVVLFKGKMTTLSVYLAKNLLCMTFLNGKEVVFKDEVDISIPSLEWFNLTLNYDKEKGLTPFINGRQKNSINRPLNFLSEDFQTLQFHGEPDKNINWMNHCQLSLFAVFIGGYNSQLASDIYSFGIENVYSISSLSNLSALFCAFKARGNILINYKEGSSLILSNIGNAKFKGSIINFVASFCQVFESSNGATFITALWSLIGLKYPDGNEEKRLISWISQVMETVCQYSEISQVQLLQINTCQIISYFIGTLPDEWITCELWSCFNRLFKNATNNKFKRSICMNVLFNYHIWIRSTFSIATRIYGEWRNFIQTVPFEYWEKVSIQYMIELLKFYIFNTQKDNETNQVSLTICLCMYDISLQHFTLEDAEAALNFCLSVKETPTLLSILKLFENVFYNKVDSNPSLFYNILLKKIPFFFTEASESAKEEVMLLFHIIYEHDNCNVSVLIDFVYCLIYQKQSRSKNALFLMKQFMAKSIGTNTTELDKASSYQVTSVVDLILSVFAANFVDSNERKSLLTPFLGKISAFPDNQIKVSNELNRHSILILVFYGIVVDVSVTPFLAAFLFRDIKNLSSAFLIIDALERFIHADFTNQIDIFINHCVSLLIANPTIQNRRAYLELFISKILYHRKIGEFSWLDRNQSHNQRKQNKNWRFPDFLIAADKKNSNQEIIDDQISSPSYIFGCIIQNNQWNEITVAKSIFQLLIILLIEDPSSINQSLISSFIYCLTNKNIDINPLLPQLSQLITLLGPNFISEPFLHNMSLRKSNKQTEEFLKKHFKQSSITPSITLYAKTTEVFDESLNIVKRIINSSILNSSSSENANINASLNANASFGELSETCFNNINMNFIIDFFTRLAVSIKLPKRPSGLLSSSLIISKTINSDQSWRRLVHKLRNERSPLLAGSLINKTRHYKRPSYFDYRFRPILLTPNGKFDIHSKASELALQQLKLQENSDSNSMQNENDTDNDNDIYSSSDLLKKSSENKKLDDEFSMDESSTKWNAPCVKINVLKKKNGTFSVYQKGYIFTDVSGKMTILKAESVLYIYWRWNLLIPNSIEIFMDNHKSYFFSFTEENDHSFVTNKLLKISLPNKIFVQTKSSSIEIQNLHLTERWLDYSMSTFDYLMALNMFSGRSFLNLSCYPVFPWILVDYASPSINIQSKPIYRDFKIPIGALNKQELNKKKERMQAEIEAATIEFNNGATDNETYNDLINRSSFLFQTGYSNQFIVTYYLLRLEPFTTHHISLMDGRFDNPNRLFNSISDSFMMLITTNSAFRELIPEFFFQPEFLLNSDKFNFGMTLKKKRVDNVELPSWSKKPVDFINKHVLALESDECGYEISNWIDLIWGCKQNGKGAVEADNTFDPHMYINNHFDSTDMRTNHIRELIGQIPIQLFESEHPKRLPRPTKNLPTIPKKVLLNLNGINNDNSNISSSSSFVVTSLNYECSSSENLKIYSVHKNGKLLVTKLKDYKGSSSATSTSTCLLNEALIPTDPRFIATCDNSTFVCSLNDGNSLLVFKPSIMKNGKCLICEEKPHIAAISCIGISANYIITGGCDASVVLWTWSKKKVNVIAQSVINNDTITAVAVSNEYGIAISCSRDGIMTIFRLPHLDFIRTVNFNPKESSKIPNRRLSMSATMNVVSQPSSSASFLSAHRVLITKGMGSIVVFLRNENEETNEKSTLIRSYTINGEWISSSSLECEVIDAIAVTSKKMIDYLIILIEQPMSQELLLIDAYTLNVLSTITTNVSTGSSGSGNEIVNESKITKFSYHEDAGIIILAYNNCEFVFVPFLLN